MIRASKWLIYVAYYNVSLTERAWLAVQVASLLPKSNPKDLWWHMALTDEGSNMVAKKIWDIPVCRVTVYFGKMRYEVYYNIFLISPP